MLRMNVRPLSNGKKHEWSYEGYTASSMCGLARKLKAAEIPDQPFEVYRGDQHSMSGKSLYSVAGKMLVEDDKGGLRYVAYKEIPVITKGKKLSLSDPQILRDSLKLTPHLQHMAEVTEDAEDESTSQC